MRFLHLITLFALCLIPVALQAADNETGVDDLAALKQEIEKLKATVATSQAALEKMQKRLEELEQKSGTAVPQAGPPPEGSPSIPTAGGTSGGGATLNPDISLIGEIRGLTTTTSGNPEDRNIVLAETELAIQGWMYPNIRGDVFTTYELADGELRPALEEGYVSFLDLHDTFHLPKNWSLIAGQKRVAFGKLNPMHANETRVGRLTSDLRNLFGGEGLVGTGAVASYLLPTQHFAQLDLGVWDVGVPEDPAQDSWRGRAYTGRLWNSFSLTDKSELEVGLNGARGGFNDGASAAPMGHINALGIDLTYRKWPGAFRRSMVQTEVMRTSHDTAGGSDSQWGGHFFANYQWDQYWDAGLLYERSDFLAPGAGYDQSLSALLTWRLTEQTRMRLQARHSFGSGIGLDADDMTLQFIWGFGPHTHALQ